MSQSDLNGGQPKARRSRPVYTLGQLGYEKVTTESMFGIRRPATREELFLGSAMLGAFLMAIFRLWAG